MNSQQTNAKRQARLLEKQRNIAIQAAIAKERAERRAAVLGTDRLLEGGRNASSSNLLEGRRNVVVEESETIASSSNLCNYILKKGSKRGEICGRKLRENSTLCSNHSKVNTVCHDDKPNDWLIRVGNGEHLFSSLPKQVWGIKSNNDDSKHFMKNAKQGDRLWFVKTKTNGLLLGVAIYDKHLDRKGENLIKIETHTNTELGYENWDGDIEVCYENFINIERFNLKTNIKAPKTIRLDSDNCSLNLENEYIYIERYVNN